MAVRGDRFFKGAAFAIPLTPLGRGIENAGKSAEFLWPATLAGTWKNRNAVQLNSGSYKKRLPFRSPAWLVREPMHDGALLAVRRGRQIHSAL